MTKHSWLKISLCLMLFLLPVYSFGDEYDVNSESIWLNTGQSLTRLAVSPLNGSLFGYTVTAGFLGMTYYALENDEKWFNDIQSYRNNWQDKMMPPANLLGDGFFHIGAYAALYQYGRAYDKHVAAMALEGQIEVALISLLIKSISSSPRPSDGIYNRSWFTFELSNNSFPSGHTMTAFCAATILGHAYKCEWLAFPLAGLVGYGRVYNRKHWPADVAAGAGLGILIGYQILKLHEADKTDKENSVQFTVMPEDDGGKLVLTWRY